MSNASRYCHIGLMSSTAGLEEEEALRESVNPFTSLTYGAYISDCNLKFFERGKMVARHGKIKTGCMIEICLTSEEPPKVEFRVNEVTIHISSNVTSSQVPLLAKVWAAYRCRLVADLQWIVESRSEEPVTQLPASTTEQTLVAELQNQLHTCEGEIQMLRAVVEEKEAQIEALQAVVEEQKKEMTAGSEGRLAFENAELQALVEQQEKVRDELAKENAQLKVQLEGRNEAEQEGERRAWAAMAEFAQRRAREIAALRRSKQHGSDRRDGTDRSRSRGRGMSLGSDPSARVAAAADNQAD